MGSCQSSPAAPPAVTTDVQSKSNGQTKESKILMTTSPTGTKTINAVEKPLAADNSNSNQINNNNNSRNNGHPQLLLVQNKRPSQGSISSNLSSNSSDHDSDFKSPLSQSLHTRRSNNNNNNNNNPTSLLSSTKSLDLSTSHRRRKSRQLAHSDSKVGLHELISGDVKNTNLVRIEVPLGQPIEEVYEGVHDGEVLGSGISGIVRLVKHRRTGVQYAVKCLDLALIDSEEGLMQLKEEIYIMCQLVRLIDVCLFECVYNVYVCVLILTLLLYDRMHERR